MRHHPPTSRRSEVGVAAETTAFTDVTVIPMDREQVLPGQTVVVTDERIAAVGATADLDVPPDAHVVDGSGRYLIPGLADMHFHISGEEQRLILAVANGITTVQALNATPTDLAWSAEIAAGRRFGPRVFAGPHASGLPAATEFTAERIDRAAAPFLSTRAYLDTFRPPVYSFQTDRESGHAFVTRAREAGADFIKTSLFLGREAFDAIVETAGSLGMSVQGHVWGDIGLEHYLASGAHPHHFSELAPYLSAHAVQGVPIQDYDFQTIDQQLPRLVELMAEHGTVFTPTANLLWYAERNFSALDLLVGRDEARYVAPSVVSAWRSPETNFAHIAFGDTGPEDTRRYLEVQQRVIATLHDGGVPLLAGTDSGAAPGSVYGFDLHLELELLVECGLTTLEALAAATSNAATFKGETGAWGVIAPGARADLVLLGADPLERITNTSRIHGVMLSGRWLPRAELDAMLDGVAEHVGIET